MDTQKQELHQMSVPHGSHPIDSAQAMLNFVFIQAGRSFADPTLRDSKRYQDGLKTFVPGFLNNYHSSLDELSTKIKFAQRVIRRDLAVLQKEREKREAEAAEKQKSVSTPAIPSPEKSARATAPKDEKESATTEDVEMEDVKESHVEDQKPVTQSKENKEPPTAVDTKPPQPTKPPPIQTQTSEQNKPSEPETAAPVTATDDLFGKTPTTAGVGNIDIDQMFEDLNSSQEMETNDNDNDLGFTMDDNATSSLLPGLEDYANSGGELNLDSNPGLDDFSMIDMTGGDTNPAATTSGPETTTTPATSSAAQQADTVTADASNMNDMNDMHDLFSFDQDDNDDWMNVTNNDNTEFDDAFYGLGD